MDIHINKYNIAVTINGITLITRAAIDFKANPTLAVGDVKISKDGGTFNNITSLPTVTPAAGTSVQVVLSNTEMQAKEVVVVFIDQTGPKEWEDLVFKIRTYGHASAMYPGDMDDIDDIKTKTDQLLFDSYGDIKATLNYTAGTVVADAGNGSSQFKTDLSSGVNDFHAEGWILITSNALAGTPPRKVKSYNGSSKKVVLSSPYSSTPADGTTFKIFVE